MSKIQVLPEHIANKIAAGEVIERPASVVKELVENAIDASATQIIIEVQNAGKKLIRVVDNGGGMSPEDAKLAFERHATSKISQLDDLFCIHTLGFRGEALSSIASVSKLELITRPAGNVSGTRIDIEGGRFINVSESGTPVGTSFTVYQLFYNTPARLKFLKSDVTEISHITSVVTHLALASPEISFRLIVDGKETVRLPAAKELRDRVIEILGKETDHDLIKILSDSGEFKIKGFIARPALTRISWSHFMCFVNGRYVVSRQMNNAVLEGYHGFLMGGRYPVGILFLEMDPKLVDVNVHPTKREVRFLHERQVQQAIIEATQRTLRQQSVIPDIQQKFVEPIENLKEPLFQTNPQAQPEQVYKPVIPKGIDYKRTNFQQLVDKALQGRSVDRMEELHLPVGSTEPKIDTPVLLEVTATSAPGKPEPAKPKRMTCAAEQENETVITMEPELFTDKLPELLPLAQLDETYIICRSGNDLLIVDQHAAHERVLFERLLPRMSASAVHIQPLLIPVVIEFSPRESSLLEEYLDDIQQMGIEIEPLGRHSFAIRAVPEIIESTDYKELLHDILDSLGIHSDRMPTDELKYQIAAVMSCRAAIKGGDSQNANEWQNLIAQLQQADNPYTCPHGRPTVIRLSKTELEKRFKRTGA